MNLSYSKINDKRLMKSLLKNWQAENLDDTINLNATVDRVSFYYVSENNVCIGWIGMGDIYTIKSLAYVFINHQQRGRGLLSDIIRDSERAFGTNALLLGKMAEIKGHVAKFAELGYSHYYRMVANDGELVADFCFNDPTIALLPIGNVGFLTNDEEIDEAIGIAGEPGTCVEFDIMKLIQVKLRKMRELKETRL